MFIIAFGFVIKVKFMYFIYITSQRYNYYIYAVLYKSFIHLIIRSITVQIAELIIFSFNVYQV